MKKLYTSFMFMLCASLGANAQLLASDDFDFTGDLSSNGWMSANSLGVNNVATTAGLMYEGYLGSGIGNAAAVGTVGQDVFKFLSVPQAAGSTPVYLSALVNVTETADKPGDYFFHLSRTSGNNLSVPYASRLYARTVGTVVNFGTSVAGTVAWGATDFAKNTTYLAILKYTNNEAGADEVKLWVLPAGVPATEELAGAPLAVETGQFAGLNTSAVVLRQGLAANAPAVTVDGVRVSNTWDLKDGALPVSLTSFAAAKSENANLLTWAVANQTNVARFELQKSTDGVSFTNIYTQNAGLLANASFAYNDQNITGQPVVYYRLKMVDKNGGVTYSKMVKVSGNLNASFGIWPNPVKDNFNIKHPMVMKAATVKIITNDGKLLKVFSLARHSYQTSLNIAELPRGMYRVLFEEGSSRTCAFMIKE